MKINTNYASSKFQVYSALKVKSSTEVNDRNILIALELLKEINREDPEFVLNYGAERLLILLIRRVNNDSTANEELENLRKAFLRNSN